MKIVFVHGWGLCPSFWDALAALFQDAEVAYIDLGFQGQPIVDVPYEKAIYVTHSLGGVWTLRHCADSVQALFMINGFMDFPIKKALPLMKRRLDVAQFFRNAGIEARIEGLDKDALLMGLDWLRDWDMRGVYDFPIFGMLGAKDQIVPLETVQEQFKQSMIHPEAGHALPQSHPEWCAQEIKGCIA